MAIDIVIVGAGCAALGAVTELIGQKDVEVSITLIDPNAWIGGRARTNPDPALPVDLGPQFIQDPEVNPWTTILKQTPGYEDDDLDPIAVDTLYRILGEDDDWTTSHGARAMSQCETMIAKAFQVATGYRNAPVLKPAMAPVFEGQAELRLALGSSGYGSIAESAEPWQYLASDSARQGEYESAGNIYVPGGLGNLVEKYGTKLLTENELVLRRKQETVDSIEERNDKVEVYTTSIQQYDVDYCLVTIPCGEVEKITFVPELPGPRLRADSYIKLGSYKKVGFKPRAFPVGEGEDDQIKEKTEYYIYDRINDGVWQYFRLPTDPDILICVTSGDFAARLDKREDQDVYEVVRDLLGEAYGDGDFKAKADKVVVTNWTKAVPIGGAYSYTWADPSLDPDNPVPFESRIEIAKPHGRVHFAGEATWPDAYGTIHGAYLSGIRAAKEILERAKSD